MLDVFYLQRINIRLQNNYNNINAIKLVVNDYNVPLFSFENVCDYKFNFTVSIISTLCLIWCLNAKNVLCQTVDQDTNQVTSGLSSFAIEMLAVSITNLIEK